MAINLKIMDKIVSKCKDDVLMRAAITNLLDIEDEGLANYKNVYKDIIEESVEVDDDEN